MRSPLSTQAEAEAPHQKAFAAYIRRGEEDGFRGLALEEKAIAVADGGFLMPNQVAESVQGALRASGSLRAVANVVQVESLTYEVLVETGDTGTAWSNDVAATVETGNANIARVSVPLHELSAMPKASQRLLDDAAFDVEAWLAERIADKFARSEAAAFIIGDGVAKPSPIPSGRASHKAWRNSGAMCASRPAPCSWATDGCRHIITPMMQMIARVHTLLPSATAPNVCALRWPASRVSIRFMPIADNWPSTRGAARRRVSASS